MTAGTRPPLVVAAGLVLIVGGALYALDSVRRLATTGSVATVNGVLAVLVGLGTVYAGVLVLRLREQGRVLGMALGTVGVAFAALALMQGYVPAVAAVILNGFVIFALVRTRDVFIA